MGTWNLDPKEHFRPAMESQVYAHLKGAANTKAELDDRFGSFKARIIDLRTSWWMLFKRYHHKMKIDGGCKLYVLYVNRMNLFIDYMIEHKFSEARFTDPDLMEMLKWEKLHHFLIPQMGTG